MKLVKLSLAAMMAVGALSTANAQPLEEAIKGVEFSGFARYRFHDVNGNNDTNIANNNDYDILAKFVAPVTENLKFTAAFTVGGGGNGSADSDYKDGGSATGSADLGKMWFTYHKDALTVKAGRQPLGTPVTDNGYRGQKGTGVVGMYNLGSVTLAAAYFNTSNAFGSYINDYIPGSKAFDSGEISAVAAIGSFGPVNAQLWAIQMVNAVDALIFAQVDGSIAGVTLTGQFINTKLDESIVGTAEDTGTFYALKAAYAMNNFKVAAGYTSNDDDQPIHALATDANNNVIAAGYRLNDDKGVNFMGGDQYFIDGSVAFGKFGLMAGYAAWEEDGAVQDEELTEFWGGVSYKYAKNFNTYVKYSDLSADIDEDLEQKFLRFEAKYTF